MLADIGHLKQEGVETSLGASPAEGEFVHEGSARSHHDTIQALFADILLDEGLTWVRAHISVIARQYNSFELGGIVRHCLHINHGGDVRSAVTDIHTYAGITSRIRIHALSSWLALRCAQATIAPKSTIQR
jgi:hypothetical protein